MAAVHRYEGTVNQVLGDGIMALWRPARPRRSCSPRLQAAWAMQTAIRHYSARRCAAPMGLGCRSVSASIAGKWWRGPLAMTCTWTIHTDDASGRPHGTASESRQYAAHGGDAPAWWRLVQVTLLGPVPVKGSTRRSRSASFRGASARPASRRGGRGLTRFVGRDRSWPPCARRSTELERPWPGGGAHREAGVGKSRLVYEFRPRPSHAGLAGAGKCVGVVWQSHPVLPGHGPAATLLPRGRRGRGAHRPRQGHGAGLDPGRDAPGSDPRAARAAGRPSGGQSVPDARSPAAARTLEALTRSSCCARARCSPCSWSVKTCTGSIPRRRRRRPPGRQRANGPSAAPGQLPSGVSLHGWSSKTAYTQLRLDPLSPVSADVLLQALLGDDPSLLVPLKQLLIARTAGNPFFLEERAYAPWWRPGCWWGARRSPGAGAADHSGASDGASGPGSAH